MIDEDGENWFILKLLLKTNIQISENKKKSCSQFLSKKNLNLE